MKVCHPRDDCISPKEISFHPISVDSVVVDENLLLTVKEQKMTSNITVASVTTRHIQTNTLNGRDLKHFYNELVLNNTSQYIKGKYTVNSTFGLSI